MSEEKQSFQAEVWQTLSAINVNDHTEKKNNMTYLSWSWAWATLMGIYPESTYKFSDFTGIGDKRQDGSFESFPIPYRSLPDGSAEVWITLTVKDGERSWTQEMWLPIINHSNKAIVNPSSAELNKSRMRCLTKVMAMFGLGHYIYAKESFPSADSGKPSGGVITEDQALQLDAFVTENNLEKEPILTWLKGKGIESFEMIPDDGSFDGLMKKLKKQVAG